MKTMTKLVVAAFAVAAALPAAAQSPDTPNQGYLTDTRGNIVTSGFGLCWHTIEWTPSRAVEGCDPVNRPRAAAVLPPPAVVAQAAPTPAPAPSPAAVPFRKKVSFSADALFAFDKAVLKPEGKVMLDGLVAELKNVNYDVIALTGHADRFGSDAYNQKLSERRANSVKDYLVVKGVPASRITAVGHGETQPETKPGDCKGPKSAKVIACLQPDRRVDVEMTGTEIGSSQ
jgi:OOP family OmpA-OmpF porin